MMKKLWTEALDLVRQGGVRDVTLKYVDAEGALVETTTGINNLSDESLEDGIALDNGDVVFPNPTTAILNPFLISPVISFICDLQKRPFNPVPASISSKKPFTAPVQSIFPVTVAGRPNQDMSLHSAISGSCAAPPAAASVSSGVETLPGPILKFVPDSEETELGVVLPPSRMTNIPTVKVNPGGSDHRGTSCHQCKNARSLDQLAFCSNLFNKRTSQDMSSFRHCRKKFCQGCLTKFYGDCLDNSNRDGWICPSCRGICRCAACTRKRRKVKTLSDDDEPFVESPVEVSSLSFPGLSHATSVIDGTDETLGMLLSGGGSSILPDLDDLHGPMLSAGGGAPSQPDLHTTHDDGSSLKALKPRPVRSSCPYNIETEHF